MPFDLKDLRYIVAIGRLRSLGRAARAVGLSQPALSKKLQRLEAALGVRLFDRSHAGAIATAYGEVVLEAALPTLRSMDDVLSELRRLQGLEAGTLRVGAGPFALELSVAEAALRIARRHPSLQLTIVQMGWWDLTREVRSGNLDVAVADVAAAEGDPHLSTERIGAHRGVFYCRTAHPLLTRTRVTLADLSRFPLALSPLPERVARFFGKLSPSGRVDPVLGLFMPAITVDTVPAMKRAVLATDAISWAPEALISVEVEAGVLVPLPIRPDWARLNYAIIRRGDRPISPSLEVFLAELRVVEREIRRSAARGGQVTTAGARARHKASTNSRRLSGGRSS